MRIAIVVKNILTLQNTYPNMPTIIKHRDWCFTCEDWKLFTVPFFKEKKKKCETCSKPLESFTGLDDEIPEEKIMEQHLFWLVPDWVI